MGYPSLQACVRDLERTKQLVRIDAEIDPYLEMAEIQRRVYAAGGPALLFTRPKACRLPKLVCWPQDGGPFITLPQVYTEDADQPGWRKSNMGMYRIQLAGNRYRLNEQVGMHYQIHRGIGVHHAAALRRGEPLKVVVTI